MQEQSIFSKRNIASFTLIFMSVQILGLEGFQISMPKVVYMCLCPVLLLGLSPKISKAIVFSIIFWSVTYLLQILQYEGVRTSTLYYTLMFLSVFCLFYNLVWEEHCYELDDFLKVVKLVIYAYAICLVLQQGVILMGRRYFPVVNLMGQHWLALFRLNSLAIEPSHAARVLTVYFYAFLKLTEFKYGYPISIRELFREYKWLLIAFVYTMIAMGSGTAMVGLALISLYFLKKQYSMAVIVLAIAFYFIAPNIDYDPFNRAFDTFNAAITMDEETVREVDRSASDRVNTIMALVKYTDVTDMQLWLGYGIDSAYKAKDHITHMSVYELGLLSYILKLLLFFSCSLCGILSLSTLMYMTIFTMFIGNIAYGFACLMVFSGVKYFQTLYSKY